jgi:hypothetical protein
MFNYTRQVIFSLYEKQLLRNWFYTFAFAIFVPVGFRFALLAWEFGGEFDKTLAVIAGIAVGVTTVVTLVRIWAVPPRKTIEPDTVAEPHADIPDQKPDAAEILAMINACSARNRYIAHGAQALGAPRRLPR